MLPSVVQGMTSLDPGMALRGRGPGPRAVSCRSGQTVTVGCAYVTGFRA